MRVLIFSCVAVLLLATTLVSAKLEYAVTPVKELPEDDRGVVNEHLKPLQDLCAQKDVYMLLRITDKTSLVKVKAGAFATKSMDVHSKSSNWGPMEGFVPVDSFFNKNSGVKDNDAGEYVDILDQKNALYKNVEHEVHHSRKLDEENEKLGQPQYKTQIGVVQMFLTQEGVDALKPKQSTDKKCKPCTDKKGMCIEDNPKNRQTKSLFCMLDAAEALPNSNPNWLTIPTPEGSGIKFASYITPQAKLYPVYVWAYKGAPVTGDYDLWGVFPKINKENAEQVVQDWATVTEFSMAGGLTYCSPGLVAFIKSANEAIGRVERPVFNHGAESHNFGFTQYLDDTLLVIPPSGEPFQIKAGVGKDDGQRPTSNLANFLTDIWHQGYLVLFNGMYEVPAAEIPTFRKFLTPEVLMLGGLSVQEAMDRRKELKPSEQQTTIHDFFNALMRDANPKFLLPQTQEFVKESSPQNINPHAFAGMFRIAQRVAESISKVMYLRITLDTIKFKYKDDLLNFVRSDESIMKMIKSSRTYAGTVERGVEVSWKDVVECVFQLLTSPTIENTKKYSDLRQKWTAIEDKVPFKLFMLYGQIKTRYAREAALMRDNEAVIMRIVRRFKDELPGGSGVSSSIQQASGAEVQPDKTGKPTGQQSVKIAKKEEVAQNQMDKAALDKTKGLGQNSRKQNKAALDKTKGLGQNSRKQNPKEGTFKKEVGKILSKFF